MAELNIITDPKSGEMIVEYLKQNFNAAIDSCEVLENQCCITTHLSLEEVLGFVRTLAKAKEIHPEIQFNEQFYLS